MKTIIETFYKALNDCDYSTMISCYHKDIVFRDPAFGVLKGDRVKAMWQMLCENQKGKDFRVELSNVETGDKKGSAHWEAFYTFSKTRRKVHNKIDASFVFKDDLIVKHTDEFSLHKWAKQALGFKGIFFGGMHYFKKKLQNQTNFLLDSYIEKKEPSK